MSSTDCIKKAEFDDIDWDWDCYESDKLHNPDWGRGSQTGPTIPVQCIVSVFEIAGCYIMLGGACVAGADLCVIEVPNSALDWCYNDKSDQD